MELNWLKYFYEVAGTQSVTLASKKMRVSQPAVTKMVKQLEVDLGYVLFRRTGRKMVLTTEGRMLFQQCIPIFKKLQEIGTLQNSLSSDSQEEFKIGASDNVCNYLLPSAIGPLRKEFPRVQWNVFSGTSYDIKQKLLSGELDYGLFYAPMTLQEKSFFNETVLARVSFVIAFSPLLGELKTIRALNRAKISYVGARKSDYPGSSPEQWIYHRLGVEIHSPLELNSKEMQKRMVMAGMGFSIFPEFMIREELNRKKLLMIPASRSEIELRWITRKDENQTRLADRFLKSLEWVMKA